MSSIPHVYILSIHTVNLTRTSYSYTLFSHSSILGISLVLQYFTHQILTETKSGIWQISNLHFTGIKEVRKQSRNLLANYNSRHLTWISTQQTSFLSTSQAPVTEEAPDGMITISKGRRPHEHQQNSWAVYSTKGCSFCSLSRVLQLLPWGTVWIVTSISVYEMEMSQPRAEIWFLRFLNDESEPESAKWSTTSPSVQMATLLWGEQ